MCECPLPAGQVTRGLVVSELFLTPDTPFKFDSEDLIRNLKAIDSEDGITGMNASRLAVRRTETLGIY